MARSSFETFAPTVRHTAFKLLAARGCVAGRRARQFDVEGAFLKGKFEDNEIVYARPPPNFPGGSQYRIFDDRGVPLVWRLNTRCPCTARPTPGASGTALP
jgi:hypothetical protein